MPFEELFARNILEHLDGFREHEDLNIQVDNKFFNYFLQSFKILQIETFWIIGN